VTKPTKENRKKSVFRNTEVTLQLADKLYNLRDLERACPRGWTSKRRDEYFHWAARVVDGLRGASPVLEEQLDRIFRARGVLPPR